MGIEKAIIGNEAVVSIQKSLSVLEGLKLLETKALRVLPVLDGERFVGLFSLRAVIKDLLPRALTLTDDIPDMEFIHGGQDDVVERLDVLDHKKIEDVMVEAKAFLTLETSTTETLRQLYVHDSPLPVIDKETHSFKGLVTLQSMLKYLHTQLEA